jgi:uncharacterized protein (DUF2164 family)
MFVSQQESGQYDMPTDVSDDIVELRQIESDNFMFVETLLNGTQLLTFYSPSANSLVRTSMEELQAGLKGAKPRFSFVELGVNEKGYPAVLPVANETANREDISTKLAEDFKQSMLSRKMQVSKDLLAANQPFTSPINNQTYDSYFDFLTAENGLSTTREEGVGSNSILAVDVIANNYGSVFYDVGLKMSNLSTVEKPTQLEEDLQVKQIAATVAPTQAPTVPATDARTDIEKTEYGTISGSRPLSEIVGEDGKYYDLGNNIFAVVFDNGKIAAIVDKNYEVNGKYITEKAFGKDGKFKSPNEKNVEITAKANNQDVAVRIQRLNQATEKLNELAALGQPVAEDTVVEITGPQSTADILDVLNITPAAPALDDPFLSRPLATAEEIQGFNEELAATDALNNQELAQAIQEYCQSQNQANN